MSPIHGHRETLEKRYAHRVLSVLYIVLTLDGNNDDVFQNICFNRNCTIVAFYSSVIFIIFNLVKHIKTC